MKYLLGMENNQLTLFDNDYILTEKANGLLDALNEGLKSKEMYFPVVYSQLNNLIVLVAQNKAKDTLFNILDVDGKTPVGMSACWRIYNEFVKDIV